MPQGYSLSGGRGLHPKANGYLTFGSSGKDLLPTKSWVFTQLIEGHPKAYPLSVLEKNQVVNDRLASQNLVVIYDTGGHGARAYERGKHTFTPAETSTVILDKTGHRWQIVENALIGPGGERLARLPGHMAYWFGWFSFYPRTEVYRIRSDGDKGN